MSNPTVLRVATFCALLAGAFSAQDASARSIRFDPGFEAFPGSPVFIWEPQTESAGFGDQVALGFNFTFGGGIATKVQINNAGELELLTASSTLLGTLTSLSVTPTVSADYGIANQADNDPLGSFIVDGNPVAVSNAFRVVWFASNNEDLAFKSQIALFALANGDSLIEFNYFDDSLEGLGIDASGASVGLINPVVGAGFNLGSALAGSACLTALGRVDDLDDEADCTGYYSSPGAAVSALPDPFRTENGGPTSDNNALADFRYLFRFPGTGVVDPNPVPVPEPATGLLFLTGVAALLLRKRRAENA